MEYGILCSLFNSDLSGNCIHNARLTFKCLVSFGVIYSCDYNYGAKEQVIDISVREKGGREREMGRKPCCPKEGLNRGAWTSMEDGILVSYIQKHGEGKWGSLPRRAGLCHSSLLLYLYSGNTCLSFCQLNSALMSAQISVPPSLFGLITS